MAIIKSATDKKGKPISYNSALKMKWVLNYINDLKKTEPELRGGVFLNEPDKAYDEFMLTKRLWNKEMGKRKCIHLIQSFTPGEGSPELIKKIADDFVKHEQFEGFQISYAVHTDKDHYHTHFIINTVNVVDGHMWQMSKQQLQSLKDYSDDLCRENNLSILEKNIDRKPCKSPAQKDAEMKGTSWKKETQLAVDEAVKIAVNKADFISIMNMQGYDVRWDSGKYILFINAEGKAMRNRLFDNPESYTKEALEEKFADNRIRQKGAYNENDVIDEEVEYHKDRKKHPEEGRDEFDKIRKETYLDVRDAKNVATSKEEFISILKSQGYNVTWDHHKYITFQKMDHKAVRNRNFYPPEKYTKEALLEKFKQNQEKMERIKSGQYNEAEIGSQERTRGDMLFILSHLFSGSHGAYPHQERMRERSVAAIEEWQKEQEKGKGIDWEQ